MTDAGWEKAQVKLAEKEAPPPPLSPRNNSMNWMPRSRAIAGGGEFFSDEMKERARLNALIDQRPRAKATKAENQG
jgi:hypothetical protein